MPEPTTQEFGTPELPDNPIYIYGRVKQKQLKNSSAGQRLAAVIELGNGARIQIPASTEQEAWDLAASSVFC